MGVISTDKNQITLIYNSNSSIGKQTLGYVDTSERETRLIDISKSNLTGTQWAEVADKLDCTISELINKEHPDFKKSYNSDINLETSDWLKIIEKTPDVVAFPIVIVGDQFHKINTPSDILKYINPDSAGISRNPAS